MVACEGLISVTWQAALYHQLNCYIPNTYHQVAVLYQTHITNALSYISPISPSYCPKPAPYCQLVVIYQPQSPYQQIIVKVFHQVIALYQPYITTSMLYTSPITTTHWCLPLQHHSTKLLSYTSPLSLTYYLLLVQYHQPFAQPFPLPTPYNTSSYHQLIKMMCIFQC